MLSKRFGRFLLVGASNAVLHFTVLNVCFSLLGLNQITSSIIATVFAISYSFLLNKNFVFRSSATIRDEVVAFVLVTAIGVLILHNLVYIAVIYLLDHQISVVNIVEETLNYRLSRDSIVINVATVVGAVAALIWNYNGYRKFVFSSKEAKHEFEKQQD